MEPPIQIYLVDGHASIAIEDAHFGFYADTKWNTGKEPQIEQVFASEGKLLGVGIDRSLAKDHVKVQSALEMAQAYQPSFEPIKKPSFLVQLASMVWNIGPVPCRVKDDSSEAKGEGLHLTVYAPKKTVRAIREYAERTKELCQTGQVSYHLFSNNCIEFVQRALEAGGIQADYRSAFQTTDYLSHLGLGELFALFSSRDPIIHPSNSSGFLSFNRLVLNRLITLPSTIFFYRMIKVLPDASKLILRYLGIIQKSFPKITS